MGYLHTLNNIVDNRKKRSGRGEGSGLGKTAGKGHKGQRARNRVRAGFEGGQTRLLQRLPFVRGKSFRGTGRPTVGLNVKDLEYLFEDGETVTVEALREKGKVGRTDKRVKILGDGEIKKALTIASEIAVSTTAEKKITSAGGSIQP